MHNESPRLSKKTSSKKLTTLLIDNYDSYTYNLFQYLAKIDQGVPPLVVTNDQYSVEELVEIVKHEHVSSIVISPGPGSPDNPSDTGICLDLVRQFPFIPILGVCFGHQILAQVYGGTTRHIDPIHGRLSRVRHDGHELFEQIPSCKFSVVRYHSLAVDESSLPYDLIPIAWTTGPTHALRANGNHKLDQDSVLMGLAHREFPHYGVQFHPESIGSDYGYQILQNFKEMVEKRNDGAFISGQEISQEWLLNEVEPEASSSLKIFWKTCTMLENLNRSTMDQIFEMFAKENDFEDSFWLDSSMESRGRFSYMGKKGGSLWKRISYRLEEDSEDGILTEINIHGHKRHEKCNLWKFLDFTLRENQALSKAEFPFDFHGGFVGYLGYELKALCGGSKAHVSPTPDAFFFFVDQFVVFDHESNQIYCVALSKTNHEESKSWVDATINKISNFTLTNVQIRLEPTSNKSSTKSGFHLDRDQSAYEADVLRCKEYLYSGDSYEICLTTQSRKVQSQEFDAWKFYRLLRTINPAPYSAWMRFGLDDDLTICSSSPERFLKADRAQVIEAKPIKGTISRSKDPIKDKEAKETLENSEKDQAENLMIVDLLRNDLGRVCEMGSIHVPKLIQIESFETVHQLVTTIRGKLDTRYTIVDAIQAAFPGGSMTGAPKIRSMEIIDQIEGKARGVYSGSLGFISVNGTFDLNIMIRSVIVTKDQLTLGAGGAIVVQSDPHSEFEEMLLKTKALCKTLTLYDQNIVG